MLADKVRWPALVAFFFLMTLVLCRPAVAQQTPPPSNPDPSSQPSSRDAQDVTKPNAAEQDAASKENQEKQKNNPTIQGQSTSGNPSSSNTGSGNSTQGKVAGTSNDRLFYTLPNFLTLQNVGQLPPLTVKEKFKVVALSTFDPVEYPWWALLAAIGQADNSEPQFRQGWVGYAKRYGITAGDSTTENLMVGAVFPSILHQDPRFYQSGKGSIGRRSWYAATRILVIRGDSGREQFNFSEVFGSAFAAAVSTYTYHPRSTYISTPTNPHMFIASDQTLSNVASVWGTQIGLDTITFVVKEFWPDVHRMLSHKHNSQAAQPPSPKP
jgi:hypothetical protein